MEKVARHVHVHLPKADIIAFQETEGALNRQLASFLQSEHHSFDYFSVFHDDSYWSKWVTEDRSFVRNGVAIALRRSAFDNITHIDLPLSTGNHVAIALARHIELDQWFRIASVHFELDDQHMRASEVESLAHFFRPGSARHAYVDVIAGDFNSDVTNPMMEKELLKRGFVDVHKALGVDKATHPELGDGDDVIDHVLIRGHGIEPTRAHTHSSDILERFPDPSHSHKSERIAATLAFNGSDHFAVEAIVRVPFGHSHGRLHSA